MYFYRDFSINYYGSIRRIFFKKVYAKEKKLPNTEQDDCQNNVVKCLIGVAPLWSEAAEQYNVPSEDEKIFCQP